MLAATWRNKVDYYYLLYAAKRNTCTGRHGYSEGKAYKYTSRTRGVDETCECERSLAAPLQDQRQPCKYRPGHILAVLVLDCLRGNAVVDFYSHGFLSGRSTTIIY